VRDKIFCDYTPSSLNKYVYIIISYAKVQQNVLRDEPNASAWTSTICVYRGVFNYFSKM